VGSVQVVNEIGERVNIRKRIAAVGASLALACAASIGGEGTAQADTGGWSTFSAIGSNWHCGSTAPIAEQSGLLAQQCIVVSGTLFQAATVVRASQNGYYQSETSDVYQGEYYYTHLCQGSILAGANKVCFSFTMDGASGNAAQGFADFPISKLWSPSVTL
jgi:hypothetical protein